MKKRDNNSSRREFIRKNCMAGLGVLLTAGTAPVIIAKARGTLPADTGEHPRGDASVTGREQAGRSDSDAGTQEDDSGRETFGQAVNEPVIDIHVHLNHGGRSNDQLLSHQQSMGISKTILLPAGREVNTASTLNGRANGLGGNPLMLGNEDCYRFAQDHPDYLFGVNEVPDLPDTIRELEKYLKLGAKVIGELKFGVDCDSPEMQNIYELAQDYDVPVLMHWQYGSYNHGFDRFHKMLEKYPRVDFIGHAQTWWANIDKNHTDQSNLRPDWKVTPGGWTDRLLRDYPNMYGDLSAGSGLNSLHRDEDHARDFLERHQDKLLYGSDDRDIAGTEPDCRGAESIATIRRLSANKSIERKLLYDNAKKLFQL